MTPSAHKAIAIVGVGAILPDAPDAPTFWSNVKSGRYSIGDVPAARWDPELYYDPDPKAPDKSYSKIGGFVRDWDWDPLKWRLPIPPRVSEAMDRTQKWAVMGAREALLDFGYPERPLDPDRTAVILGNAMAGDKHYMTALRIFFPEYADELEKAPSFKSLSAQARRAIVEELRAGIGERLPEINEDTMPGELSNIIAGRVANLFNFHGPNFVTDAACASAMAAMNAAVEGLVEHDYDAVVTGGIDANMSPSSYIKFCKIGALSATGTRPYGDGADGFVMGEGAAVFLLERLEDAERNGHRIYALIRGFGGSSDGKGKGITAPNPVGQRFAVERGWRNAGLHPGAATMIEGHGTSTKVGDVVEVESLSAVFKDFGLAPGSIPLGSVKSNIGHLKGAAGAAGILKAALCLKERVLPPSLGSKKLNPNIDFVQTPFYVNQELRPWEVANGDLRTAGVSAFGFGGTNFHAVLEEYVPGRSGHDTARKSSQVAVPGRAASSSAAAKPPLRGALLLGAESEPTLVEQMKKAHRDAAQGWTPAIAAPAADALRAAERVTVDFSDAGELEVKLARALKAQESGRKAAWSALGSQGVFRGRGEAGKVAFLYTGQGSQYVNMLRQLAARESVVAATLDEADRVMSPILGRPLRDFMFCASDDKAALERAAEPLRRTEITQPAVLTVDVALTRLLAQYGFAPDMVMGHSLGEYAALVAAGSLTFKEALEAVSARGQEMSKVSVADNGLMAAVTAPLEEIERTLAGIDGYVVVANINSTRQAVIGGASAATRQAMAALQEHGYQVTPLAVSHAFHTEIVAPVSEPLRQMLKRIDIRVPKLPIVSNVTGDFYPDHPHREHSRNGEMIELLGRQIASPVQFVRGLETLHAAGARIFVEVGPKRALHGFAHDVLGHHEDVLALHTNHPRVGDVRSFNVALCGLWASGVGEPVSATLSAAASSPAVSAEPSPPALSPREREPEGAARPVVISGAGLGLPGTERVFDDRNVARILEGESFLDVIPLRLRRAMVERNVTRLVKSADGDPRFETISEEAEVIKLASRKGKLDLAEDFGFPPDRLAALDVTTELAIGAGLDALRDAGIPLVQHYRKTSKGTYLPERWGLPEDLRDSTGVIFASAFPGVNYFADESRRFYEDRARRQRLAELEDLRQRAAGDSGVTVELERRIASLRAELERDAYGFDRRFLFRLLSMGHAQFAEFIGARGPNTQVNAACASTAQAVSLAEDWIRLGRCRRVVVISADDVTSDALLGWIGSGFLATGAAATDAVVEEAALPFDRRRHGMLIGMGAAALVVENADATAQRGLAPICEILASETQNSAFHGTRLDVEHICQVMEDLVKKAEERWGISRAEIAPRTLFVSHETYTPARGGSAQAEIHALRRVFGERAAEQIVITNTKGFTGHAMGTGIEDVVAVKALETGVVPPVPHFKEVDPDLGQLHLSRGGVYPVDYALRLAAGFGSQISLTLTRHVPCGERRPVPEALGYAGRVVDAAAWQSWLDRAGGRPGAEVEVWKRTLRVKDRGATAKVEARPAVAEPEPVAVPSTTSIPFTTSKPEPVPEALTPQPPLPGGEGESEPLTPTLSPAEREPEPGDAVAARVLEIVAEKTGYPPDMLDLDLDLEADLGIDTVKQAETFAAIREAWDIPRDDNIQLREYPTLQHAIEFVYKNRPDLRQGAAPAAETLTPALSPGEREPEVEPAGVVGDAAAMARVPRRVPVPVLRPDIGVCKPTGVSLDEGKRVIVLPDEGGVGKALVGRLEKRGVTSLVLDADASESAESLEKRLAEWTSEGPIDGVFWLAALDDEGELTELDAGAWRKALDRRVKFLYRTARALYERFAAPGTFLVTATRLGGLHGYGEDGATAPLGGAVTGFAKTFKRERPAALVKAVDFAPSRKTAALADRLVDEALYDPGVVEVGYRDGARFSVGLVKRPAESELFELGPETVYLVTGAAGSIVSAIITELASTGGLFHLLDLAPEPDRQSEDLRRFASDRDGLKRDLFERLKASGERATPAKVEKQLAGLERQHAAVQAIQAIERAGGRAMYHQVDLRDGDAVTAIAEQIRREHERLDVLLHAAGLEISHFLPDKSPQEYDLVFDVKADGFFHLLRGLGDLPIGATVGFSSIAGRFGNAGQADYSAANDLLCKIGASLRRGRPGLRAVTLDWTAWGGIGMATRGSIPQMMELAGIDMLPPEAGIPIVRRELASGGGEVVIGLSLGALLEEWDDTGGLDVAKLDLEPQPMAAEVKSLGLHSGLVVETTLDPEEQPFLYDHQIDGTPVLPGVMGIEAFAEAARLLQPEWKVTAIENVHFLAPFKFYRHEPRTVRVEALPVRVGEELWAECRLLGERRLPKQEEAQKTVHFTARVRLGRAAVDTAERAWPEESAKTLAGEAIYRVYFHGPAYQVVEKAWNGSTEAFGLLPAELPANHRPEDLATLMEPRLIELCFQTAGLWEIAKAGKMALPMKVARVIRRGNGESPRGRLCAVVRVNESGGFDAQVVDEDGRVHLELEGYSTVELPGGVGEEEVEGFRAVLG